MTALERQMIEVICMNRKRPCITKGDVEFAISLGYPNKYLHLDNRIKLEAIIRKLAMSANSSLFSKVRR